ncbi:DMT family transporter [Magnetospirillum aberrantis]|uniref:DMT family transporter n=1 Tax=Magnetospirillum aberrantis SpK TaxID=908842 RepID=A0A7C9QRM4_9PROT|nr:DMT family transporter [Magnetospirillum aberrantis]NFV78724.1 DMT family transporter [Magnetospirillum aberrantis SpK]
MGPQSTIGLLVLAIVMWGANFNLSQPALAEMHPLAAAAARFAVAALIMVAVAAWRRERVPLLRHAKAYGALGLVGIAGFNVFFFYGLQATTPVNGALIQATNPLVTTLLAALFLGERPSRRQMLAFPVALAGVAVVLLGGGASLALSPGDGLIMAANLCWAVYNVMARRLMPPVSGIANTTALMVVGAVLLASFATLAGVPVTVPGPTATAAVLTMGLGGTVLSYLFYNAALARLGAGRTALFLNLVPVVAMTIAALTGTPPTALQVAGAVVTIGAVTAAMLPGRRRAAA